MADDGGLARFQARMQAIPKAARDAVKPALVKSAEEIATLQRLAAQSSRDTGALIDSIKVTGPGGTTPPYSQPGGSMTVPENQAVITVGNTDVRYAHLVEFGTRARMLTSGTQAGTHPGTAAQPFFWPGFRLGRKRALGRIKRAIGKAIREAK
ncbi:HK97 gp10 family phage protein [Paracoccus sp. KR1-242]|uniref:HK97 gp10 family phage protein n=1 Tax=Paracoccus sp. KR1-242 TaxID=3410028 RepID=UPI003C007BA0